MTILSSKRTPLLAKIATQLAARSSCCCPGDSPSCDADYFVNSNFSNCVFEYLLGNRFRFTLSATGHLEDWDNIGSGPFLAFTDWNYDFTGTFNLMPDGPTACLSDTKEGVLIPGYGYLVSGSHIIHRNNGIDRCCRVLESNFDYNYDYSGLDREGVALNQVIDKDTFLEVFIQFANGKWGLADPTIGLFGTISSSNPWPRNFLGLLFDTSRFVLDTYGGNQSALVGFSDAAPGYPPSIGCDGSFSGTVCGIQNARRVTVDSTITDNGTDLSIFFTYDGISRDGGEGCRVVHCTAAVALDITRL